MQIVEHLRIPADVGVQNVFRKLQLHGHGVAIVVVANVFAPIDQRRIKILWVREMPAIDIDHAVAAVDFDDGSDERDDAIADFADIRAVIDGEAIGKLHQRGGSAGFGRMDGASDVINRDGFGDEFVGFGVVELDGAGIGKLREALVILLEIFQVGFGGDGHGNHFAAFLGGADGENFDARRGLLAGGACTCRPLRRREGCRERRRRRRGPLQE